MAIRLRLRHSSPGNSGSAPTIKHPVDQWLPPAKLAVYGLQHVLAFYAGAVVVPLILAGAIKLSPAQTVHLINADLFTCGIASLLQTVGFWKIGVRLPLLQGVTFTAVSPMIVIALDHGGGTSGLVYIYGAVMVAGLVTLFAAPYFSKLIRLFPPVVTGSVITIIGVVLLPVAANDAAGGVGSPDYGSLRNLAYAGFTLLLVIVLYRFSRGFLSTVAVLLGLVIGTAVAGILGDAHFDGVRKAGWFGLTTPFYFGAPKFAVLPILLMIVVMLITAVETTGDVFATGQIVEKSIGKDDIARALRADGLATFLGGVFNSFPYTCFAENVGLVRLTRVKSRWVVATAGLIMILFGLLPKAGALVAAVPPAVLGGAALVMFGTVAAIGIQTLGRADFHNQRNVVIVAVSLGMALIPVGTPQLAGGAGSVFFSHLPTNVRLFLDSGITAGSITAILLNLLLNVIGGRSAGTAGRDDHRVTINDVNGMSRDVFLNIVDTLYPGPTGLGEAANGKRPYAGAHELRTSLQDSLFSLSPDRQRELMQHYPELAGADVMGGQVAEATTRDQTAAGLTFLSEDDRNQYLELNAAYREKFGMPLIICLRDVTPEQVLDQGWSRLDNSPAQEHAAALLEIAKIANYRLADLVADTNPVHSVRKQGLQPSH